MLTFSNSRPQCLTLTFALISLLMACEKTVQIPLPSAACQAAWADSVAIDFVNQLEAATKDQHPVWPGYRLGDGPVVLDAGFTPDSTAHCLGLWHQGKLVDYKESTEGPRLSTPLYGFQLNYRDLQKPDELLVQVSQQPDTITAWLDEYGLETAVLMPVDFPNFPFKIPPLKKMQVAIHESFHVEIMLRYWYTGKGNWPAWDQQPDLDAVNQCYSLNEEVSTAFQEEKKMLLNVITALLDENEEKALEAGEQYLALRDARYELLGDFTLSRQDESQCDCAEAESLMELEEGLADFGSWTMLYEIGLSSREELLQRYGAIQNAEYYLTGSMLMHAISMMHEGDIFEVIGRMNNSESIEEGALINIFRNMLASSK